MKQTINAFLLIVVFTVILGLIYPFAVMGLGKIFFPKQANGSIIIENGKVIGSELIQQQFTSEKYFHGRPAGFGLKDYPSSKGMFAKVEKRAKDFQQNNNSDKPVPVEMVTDSGSSLDPEISPDAAFYQAARIAKARDIPIDKVDKLINENINARVFGFLGENRVNVLKLNVELDKLSQNNT